MQWQKAGRRSDKQQQEIKKNDEPWKRSELKLVVDGPCELAIHVVKQWIADGRPDEDYPGIIPWLNIIESSMIDKNKRLELNDLDGLLGEVDG